LDKNGDSALSADLSQQEWQTLARFARAVFELASAHLGKDGRTHVPVCHSSSGITVAFEGLKKYGNTV
jgi:hypothetical protein